VNDELLHYRTAWAIMSSALAGDSAEEIERNYVIPRWMAEYYMDHAKIWTAERDQLREAMIRIRDLYDFRGRVLERPCRQCGYKPKMIHLSGEGGAE